jgi:hypothetical protein
MSYKRLKGKARELLLANGNHFSLVIAFIIVAATCAMSIVALTIINDFIFDGAVTLLLFTFFFFMVSPMLSGLYRMAGFAYPHKEYAIIDVFYAFSTLKNYLRVLFVSLVELLKLIVPAFVGLVGYAILFSILGHTAISALIAVIAGILAAIAVFVFGKRFYAVSYLVYVEEMTVAAAIKNSFRYTKGISLKLTLIGARFLPMTILSFVALMLPFLVYNFPFRLCLYPVICGELKLDYERKSQISEIVNDICPAILSAGVEDINEQDS